MSFSMWMIAVLVANPSVAERETPLRRVARETPSKTIEALVRVPEGSWALPMLESTGVRFRRASAGRLRHAGRVHPIDAPAAVLAMLADLGWQIDVDMGGPVGAPTAHTGTETQAWAVQARGPTPLDGPTGRGITVLDVDFGIDVFHPHLFAADGGAAPWVDVDDDGRLTIGVDGIDRDDDGTIAGDETIALFDYSELGEPGDGTFDPSTDYVYLDVDGNGRRDHGEGFDESTPGYGEPTFLPDDANGDGIVDTSERVVLLSTSKIGALRYDGQVWRRGVDLIDAPPPPNYHGTSMTGILVGGQDRLFRRHRGLADGVDMLMFQLTGASEADYVEAFDWAVEEEGADVILHEYSSYAHTVLDGSRLRDVAIDDSSAAGIVHVCPAGNLAMGNRHARYDGMPVVFDAYVPDGPLEFWWTLHWRAPDTELMCVLRDPAGDELAIVPNTEQMLGTATVENDRWDSANGTSILGLDVVPQGQTEGFWTIECTHDSVAPIEVHAFIGDDVDFWNPYTSLVDSDPSSTMCHPSTATSCITVGAYESQYPDFVRAGELGPWSSRGPRIDGGKTIDIAAPRDPLVPVPLADPAQRSFEFTLVGGTSSAGAVVTAAVAQLLEAEPTLGSDEVRARLFASAEVDGFVDAPTPDDGWGHGKLRAHAALYDDAPSPAPELVTRALEVEFQAEPGQCTAIVRVPDVDWDSASFRWDDDYDGAWDSTYEPSPERAITIDPERRSFATRVELGHGGWRVGGAALAGDVPDSCFIGGADTSGGSESDTMNDGSESDAVDDTTAGDGTTSDGTADTSDPGSAESGGNDGCGCSNTTARSPWLVLLPLVATRRKRRAMR